MSDYNSQEHAGLSASTRVRRQEGTAPVLMLEPVSEPQECSVEREARELCTLDRAPGPALS